MTNPAAIALLGRIAEELTDYPATFEAAMVEAASDGWRSFKDDGNHTIDVTPAEAEILRPLVTEGRKRIIDRDFVRGIEVPDRGRDSMNGPGARIVNVDCNEAVYVSVNGVKDGEATLVIRIGGDYHAIR